MVTADRPPGPVRGFRDLVVWQRSRELIRLSFALSRQLPRAEQLDLARQIRRAAMSVASNIAEGHGRFSRADYARHIAIARGSLMELESLLECSVDAQYLAAPQLIEPLKAADEIGRMLWSLGRSLGSRQLPAKARRRPPVP